MVKGKVWSNQGKDGYSYWWASWITKYPEVFLHFCRYCELPRGWGARLSFWHIVHIYISSINLLDHIFITKNMTQKIYIGQGLGRGTETPCLVHVCHFSIISTCLPTWKLFKKGPMCFLLDFYGGFIKEWWLTKSLVTGDSSNLQLLSPPCGVCEKVGGTESSILLSYAWLHWHQPPSLGAFKS